MNELEKTLAEARESIIEYDGVDWVGFASAAANCTKSLRDLIAALDASGVLQDAARWQWFTDDLERNHGVSRARINASTDATMKGAE